MPPVASYAANRVSQKGRREMKLPEYAGLIGKLPPLLAEH